MNNAATFFCFRLAHLCAGYLAFVLCVAIGVLSFTTPSEARDIWSKGDIASLFPPAPDGWRASTIEVEPLKPATDLEKFVSTLENFANVLNENFDAGVGIRLRATRDYSFDGQKISMTIDSDDIDNAINIDAMMAAFASGDEATRARLKSNGVSTITHNGMPGVAMDTADKVGRAYKVGSTGVVALECSYFDCSQILDSMAKQINFSAVAEFVSFEHRLQEP